MPGVFEITENLWPGEGDGRTRFLLNRESLPANAQVLKAGMSRERHA